MFCLAKALGINYDQISVQFINNFCIYPDQTLDPLCVCTHSIGRIEFAHQIRVTMGYLDEAVPCTPGTAQLVQGQATECVHIGNN